MTTRADKESPVTCAVCGRPAIRRELPVEGRRTSYDTHATSLTDRQWFAALLRMNAFMEKAVALEKKLNAQCPLALEVGSIISVDVETVRPEACSPRELLRVSARLRAFSQFGQVRTEAIPLKGLRDASVIKQIKALALDAARQLKAKFERGDF